jgi:hypothetical protein
MNAFGLLLYRQSATADVPRFGAYKDAATSEYGLLKFKT